MVCSLHSVTTGSRDRANVSLIIIIPGSVLSINRRIPTAGGGEENVTRRGLLMFYE